MHFGSDDSCAIQDICTSKVFGGTEDSSDGLAIQMRWFAKGFSATRSFGLNIWTLMKARWDHSCEDIRWIFRVLRAAVIWNASAIANTMKRTAL